MTDLHIIVAAFLIAALAKIISEVYMYTYEKTKVVKALEERIDEQDKTIALYHDMGEALEIRVQKVEKRNVELNDKVNGLMNAAPIRNRTAGPLNFDRNAM